jgi:tetratricopeptide (TPR) repeat protein
MTRTFRAIRSKVFELCGQSKHDDAIALCQAKIGKAKSEEDRVRISLLLPYILDSAGRLSECKELLQSILAKNALDRAARSHLLRVFIELGDLVQAIVTANQLIEIDAKFPFQSFTSSAYFHKAYAACRLRRFKQAKLALDKSDEKDPIWIDEGLISREQLASGIARKKFGPV